MEKKEKRLLSNADDVPNSLLGGSGNSFIPISDSASLETNDSNFIFFFGKSQIGKSVILASMLYYMNAKAGILRPKVSSPNTREAEILLFDMLDNLKRGILPKRTVVEQVTRIDLIFEPNNMSKKVKPISLSFLEMSGEDLVKVKRGGSFHRSIDEYLNADIPINFLLVTDYENANDDDALMISFLHELEKKRRNYKRVNLILIVAKWDKSGNMGIPHEEYLNDFIRDHMPMTNSQLDTNQLYKTYYTVGQIARNEKGEDRLVQLNLATAKVLTDWIYESITGVEIEFEGTFLERLFGKKR